MCCKIPSIVASLSLTGQTADISQTIFTPAAEGVFRLSLYMQNDLGSGAGTGNVHVTYTDSAHARNLTVPDLSGQYAQTGIKGFVLLLELAADEPLAIATTLDSPISFNLFAIVEQLDC